MPTYRWICPKCRVIYEKTMKMPEYQSTFECESCGYPEVKRIFDVPTIHWSVGFERNRKTPLRPDGSSKLAKKMWESSGD